MTDLKKLLLDLSFEQKAQRVLSRVLFRDYVVELAPENGRWTREPSEIHMYVKSQRFSRLMMRLFSRSEFPFSSYVERKLQNDETGCLAMVMPSVRRQDSSVALFSAAIYITIERLDELLANAQNPQSFYQLFYETEFGRFLAKIEGVWVYLYIAAERGLDATQIQDELRTGIQQLEVRQWHLKRPIDGAVICAFLAEYAALFPGAKGPDNYVAEKA
jgi:hypothetical protein